MKKISKTIISALMIFALVLPGIIVQAEEYVNIAPYASITPSTTRAVDDSVNLNDGNKSVKDQALSWVARKGLHLTFDFGESVAINKVDVYEFNYFKAQRLRGYKVQVSDDNKSWKTVSEKDSSYLLCDQKIANTHFLGSIEFAKVNARYLRLTVVDVIDPSGDTTKNVAYIEEIEISGTKPSKSAAVTPGTSGDAGSNAALQPFNGNNIAANAVITPSTTRAVDDSVNINDGNKKAKDQAQTWLARKALNLVFDFGESVSFNRVDVYEFNYFKTPRLKGYKIQISNDGKRWETVAEQDSSYQLCPKTISNTHYFGGIEFAKVSARYLRFNVVDVIDPSGDTTKNVAYIEEIEVFDTNPGASSTEKEETPATTQPSTNVGVESIYKIYVNGNLLVLDTEPTNVNGRLLVPFRAICEALGMNVSWDAANQKVTAVKDGKTIIMTIGNAQINVDNNLITSDVAPMIKNSRTLVPLRFLAENIGADVQWDGSTNTVTIKY